MEARTLEWRLNNLGISQENLVERIIVDKGNNVSDLVYFSTRLGYLKKSVLVLKETLGNSKEYRNSVTFFCNPKHQRFFIRSLFYGVLTGLYSCALDDNFTNGLIAGTIIAAFNTYILKDEDNERDVKVWKKYKKRKN